VSFSIKVIAITRGAGALSEEVERHILLAKPFIQLNVTYVKPNGKELEGRAADEKAVMRLWPDASYPVALTEDGRTLDSISFAKWLEQRMVSATPLILNIGGAYGFTDAFKKRCREKISLSALTFTHSLALLVTMEQIYRACTILKKHPYHK
jgi:23S rRNA (pseudouridine1915-N3)-methyltransferase